MLSPSAVIDPLSAESCEQLYYELSRHLSATALESLTKLHITQRELRTYSLEKPAPGSAVRLPLDMWIPRLNREKVIVAWERRST